MRLEELIFFFFSSRRRHTRLVSDWSSDVCSSDLTAVAVALAELYSEIIGEETRQRHRVTRAQVVGMLDDAGAVAFGVAFPVVFFVLAAVHVIELDTALTLAKWSGLVLIGFYGYWAARFAGASVPGALLRAALVALVGGALIVLKVLFH